MSTTPQACNLTISPTLPDLAMASFATPTPTSLTSIYTQLFLHSALIAAENAKPMKTKAEAKLVEVKASRKQRQNLRLSSVENKAPGGQKLQGTKPSAQPPKLTSRSASKLPSPITTPLLKSSLADKADQAHLQANLDHSLQTKLGLRRNHAGKIKGAKDQMPQQFIKCTGYRTKARNDGKKRQDYGTRKSLN